MRPTPSQDRQIRAALREVRALRDALDADGENDLGGALADACSGLQYAVDIIDGRMPGQMIGALAQVSGAVDVPRRDPRAASASTRSRGGRR